MQLPLQPWALGTCVAHGHRDALVSFWLAAPQDQLEAFWGSPLGQASRQLVAQLNASTVFTPEQIATRDAINQRLMQGGLQQPLAPQFLLAVFLYSPPTLMKVANPEQQLPAWLAKAYREMYEAPTPVTLGASSAPAQHQAVPQPDFGQFPATLQELVGNRIQLNRMLGLSNLYYIDPEDQEILQELLQLRSSLVQAIERCPEQQLEQLWATDLGDRYWAMVRSGVQKEPLSASDQNIKQLAAQRLTPSSGGGFGTPGALNAFLVAMVYFEPGSMRVEGAEQKLPAWLFPHYQQIFAQPLAA